MFMKRFVALLLLLVCASAWGASAPPVDGIYWDPSENGRGYAVETQDDLMFVAIYNYDTDGSPSFYVIQGEWNGTTHQIDGALQHNGMVSFATALRPADAEAIRQYLIKRANEDKALEALTTSKK